VAASVVAGTTAGFHVTIANKGTGLADGLVLSDPLPALGGGDTWSINTSAAGTSPASFQIVNVDGTQTLELASGADTLANGTSLSVEVIGSPSASGTLSSTATVDAGNVVAHNQRATAKIQVTTLRG
jgi:hypothetical protein